VLQDVVELIDQLSRCHTSRTWLATANELVAPVRVEVSGDHIVVSGATSAERRIFERVLRASFRSVVALRRTGEVSHRAHARLRDLAVVEDERIVARSASMRRVLAQLPPIAAHDISVLILGETGVGKELVARRIHALSRRARRPFVAVNCGALPEALVESLLFGHERGAFTGATRRSLGFFERAHQGTLFLDEVGELPRSSQVKLLRAVETGQITRVGGESSHVDVRIVAATHRELDASPQFRADLYFRLATCVIRIPPLRDRPADIEALAHALVERHARARHLTPPRLSKAAITTLRAHAWPGNVRELENVIARSIILHDGGVLEIDIGRVRPSAAQTWSAGTRRLIEAALDASDGRIYGANGAAAKLGLRPTTLQSKMSKLGVRSRRS
jgi:DNA-binding NtrC family response regulator